MAVRIIKGGTPTIYIRQNKFGTWARTANPNIEFDVVDAAAIDDSGVRMKPGLQNVTVEISALFDSSGSASHEIFDDLVNNDRPISIYQNGAGTGSEGWGFASASLDAYIPSGAPGDLLEISGVVRQDGTFDRLLSLGIEQTVTANTTGGTVDNGASSTGNGRFYLHLTGSNIVSGGNAIWAATLQHSSNTTAASFTNVATASFGSGTRGATAIEFTGTSGTIKRYTRLIITRDATTGTFGIQAGIARDPDPAIQG